MKSNLHKFLLILSFSFWILPLIGFEMDSIKQERISALHKELKAQFAPDSRTRLLELNVIDINSDSYEFVTTEKEAADQIRKISKDLDAQIKVTVLPDETVGENKYGIVNLSVANLRTKPSHAAEMATQILMGTQVDILHKKGGDFRIRTPEGYIAWIPTSSVVPMDIEGIKTWKAQPKIIYTEDFGKSYSTKDVTGIRVSDLVYGDILTLTGEEGEFYKVSYPDGRIAYLEKKEATPFKDWIASRNANQQNIIKSAKSMLGLPYLWGGTSVKGVDCSGFTKTSFFMNGLVIPRDASQQVLAGQDIDILDSEGNFSPEKAAKNLQPADLLFFAAGKNSSANARVTHVAIYLGNGEFIHSAGTVRINSMLKDAPNYDDFQTRTVVAAKRYLGISDQQIQEIASHSYYN